MNPTLSIVIITHNRAARITACLCSIARMITDGLRYEVIVILDSCHDDTQQALESLRSGLPFPLVINSVQARRPAVARNRGARLARGFVLLFLDDDVTASPGLASEHMLSQQHADVVIGYLKAGFTQKPNWWQLGARIWWEDRFTAMKEPDYEMGFRDFFSANVSIKAPNFRATGGFDESLERLEDYELGLRLEQSGARFTFNPCALATHWETGRVTRWVNRGALEANAEIHMGRKHPDSRRAIFHDRIEKGDTRLTEWAGTMRGLAFRRRAFMDIPIKLVTLSLPILEGLKARQTWRHFMGAAHEYNYWKAIARHFVLEQEFFTWIDN